MRTALTGRTHGCTDQCCKREKTLANLEPAATELLNRAAARLQLSARAYMRIIKVARTIADLAQSDDIKIEHLAEAIQYRSLDREGWAG